MTDGRFESTYRTLGWQERAHWTRKHLTDPGHMEDHLQRESCPFHDLRADGCFQPEDANIGADVVAIPPDHLCSRSKLPAFRAGALPKHHAGRGIGGQPIPIDTAKGMDLHKAMQTPRSTHPWSNSKRTGGLFGSYEHLDDGRASVKTPRAPPAANFRVGTANGLIGAHPPFVPPGEHSNKGSNAVRPLWRLPAGRAPDVTRPTGMPEPEPPKTTRPTLRNFPHGPFDAVAGDKDRREGGFSARAPVLPDPVPTTAIKRHPRPLFTYAAKTKRSMPVAVSWRTGAQTAQPDTAGQDVNMLSTNVSNVAQRGPVPTLALERTLLKQAAA